MFSTTKSRCFSLRATAPCLAVAILALGLCGGGGGTFAQTAQPPQTRIRPIQPTRAFRLFNDKDLTGWYTFFPSKGVNNDTDRIITVENDGIIHITGKEFGYMATEVSYAYYRIQFEVKWGEKKWPPREKAVRDSGILVHMIGPDKVWPKSWECQVQENDFGDIFHIGGISSIANGKRQNNRVVRSANFEKPHGEWNTVEVICDGNTLTNIVNGHVVNVSTDVTRGRDGTGGQLNFGKIAFQSEGAEVYYRNIIIKPLAGTGTQP